LLLHAAFIYSIICAYKRDVWSWTWHESSAKAVHSGIDELELSQVDGLLALL
jgi:hypothetical protein